MRTGFSSDGAPLACSVASSLMSALLIEFANERSRRVWTSGRSLPPPHAARQMTKGISSATAKRTGAQGTSRLVPGSQLPFPETVGPADVEDEAHLRARWRDRSAGA